LQNSEKSVDKKEEQGSGEYDRKEENAESENSLRERELVIKLTKSTPVYDLGGVLVKKR